MKRVVYVTQRYPVVTETFTVNEVLGLRARGHDVAVSALRPVPAGAPAEFAELEPARVIAPGDACPAAVARALVAVPPIRRPHRRLLAAVRGAALATHLDRARDHIHAQFPLDAAGVGLYAALASGTSYSFSGHTYHDLDLMHAKLANARFVVVGSEFERDLLERRYGSRWRDRVHVRRLGVPERPQRGEPERGTIVSVGTLTGKKGHAVLIGALGELDRRGVRPTLEILGEGPERPELERLVRELRLEARVSLLGAVPPREALARVARAEVFALACRETADGDHDCLPVALMDAMSLGVPCVSSAAFGIPELIVDTQSGFLAPPGDHVALADRLEIVLRDSDLRNRVGAAGRATVRAGYDLDRNVAALADLFAAKLS